MTFNHTRSACYIGYITQAIVNNLAPLLFIVFQTRFDVPVERLGRLVLLNFGTQLLTDALVVRFSAHLGFRASLIGAHVLAAVGLILLGVLPSTMADPYMGMCIAIVIYAVGGGMLEVMVSPVIEALPTPKSHKAAAMSLLHSFYCWGQVSVVAGTTLLLAKIGHDRWAWLPAVWAIVPVLNLGLLIGAPMPAVVQEMDRTRLLELFRTPAFAMALMLMLCAGAAELTISQWSSLFAERALGVSKVWGDLAGPCLFAILMGIGRVIYGLGGKSIALVPALIFCGCLATACYLVTALSAHPWVSLIACAVCGFAVSLLWPGTFSLSAARFPMGGTAMFGVLAILGDAGGALGPWLAGETADAAMRSTGPLARVTAHLADDGGSGLRIGLLVSTLFPVAIVVLTIAYALTRRSPDASIQQIHPEHAPD